MELTARFPGNRIDHHPSVSVWYEIRISKQSFVSSTTLSASVFDYAMPMIHVATPKPVVKQL